MVTDHRQTNNRVTFVLLEAADSQSPLKNMAKIPQTLARKAR